MVIKNTKPEKKLVPAHRLLLGLASIVASSTISSPPVLAATLANSEAAFELENLSHRPDTTSTFTNIDGFTTASPPGGVVKNSAQSIALFLSKATTASSKSFSSALGEGSNYLGEGLSEARVRGTFFIEAGESFSFDFVSSLDLETSIDNSQLESGTATGEISFRLLDSTTVLDDFTLFGNLSTPGETSDFLDLDSSESITLANNLQTRSFGGNEELATASVQGSFERFFAFQTALTLIEFQTNNVSVEARPVSIPESNFGLGFLVFGGALSLKQIFRRSDRKI